MQLRQQSLSGPSLVALRLHLLGYGRVGPALKNFRSSDSKRVSRELMRISSPVEAQVPSMIHWLFSVQQEWQCDVEAESIPFRTGTEVAG